MRHRDVIVYRKNNPIVFALDGKLPDEFNKCIPDFLPVHTFKVYVDSIQIVLNRHGNNLVYQILSLRGMGQDFCCIDIFIFQIADKRPDFNPLVMTVIYIIQACQVGNVSIVVIQIKPGRREYIDSSGIGKDRGNRVICRLVCDLMPGHTDIVIFLYMCKGIWSEIAFSCFFLDGGKHTFLHVSNNTVICHYFVPVVALFDHGDFLFGRNFFQNRAFDASSYAQGGIFFGSGSLVFSPLAGNNDPVGIFYMFVFKIGIFLYKIQINICSIRVYGNNFTAVICGRFCNHITGLLCLCRDQILCCCIEKDILVIVPVKT